jgi:CRISPR system Cascade subunit CasB
VSTTTEVQRYWDRHARQDGSWRIDPHTQQERRPRGEELAAMRSGLGREPVTVPALWPHYTCPVDDRLALLGEVSREQRAEHGALTLYGLHQQGKKDSMHRHGVQPAAALRQLRRSGTCSEEALDARVGATLQASSTSAFLRCLRGLVTQLRGANLGFDYNQLMTDIAAWDTPSARPRVRRAWGMAYHVWDRREDNEPGDN